VHPRSIAVLKQADTCLENCKRFLASGNWMIEKSFFKAVFFIEN
jgi:hypothetical protein